DGRARLVAQVRVLGPAVDPVRQALELALENRLSALEDERDADLRRHGLTLLHDGNVVTARDVVLGDDRLALLGENERSVAELAAPRRRSPIAARAKADGQLEQIRATHESSTVATRSISQTRIVIV